MQAQINFPSIFRGADCRYFTLLSKTILEGLFAVDYDIVGGGDLRLSAFAVKCVPGA